MAVNQPTRIDRLKHIKKTSNIDAFLFTSLSTIKCFSGYFYNFEIGQSPFQLLPAALLVIPSRNTTIILADNEDFKKEGIGADVVVKQYASYQYQNPLSFTADFQQKIKEAILEFNLSSATLGVEGNTLPFSVSKSITANFPRVSFVDVTNEISQLKAVKDPDEIELIRKATALCDIGQVAVLKHAKAGITELELLSLIRTEMEAEIGTRLPMMLDLVSGARTEDGGGIPSGKVIEEGDLILSDLTPCLNGYWGDTCNTIIVGKPKEEQKKYFKLIEEGLQKAIDLVKPGVKASKVDQVLRRHLASVADYGHHTGHGVGTNNHEEPRIVPYNDTLLEPNMIIALEPAIYTNGYGMRLEHLLLVTETGCESISKFKHRFEQS